MGRKQQRPLDKSDRTLIDHIESRNAYSLRLGKKPHPLKASDRMQLGRIRERLKWALDDLVFATKTLPEDQLKQVLTEEVLDPFFSGLLLPKYSRRLDPDGKQYRETQKRRFEIAALMMQKGTTKCLEREVVAHFKETQAKAVDLMTILGYAAIGEWSNNFNYSYTPNDWINGKRSPVTIKKA